MLIELREGARCACGAQASIAHFKVCRMFYAPTKTHNAVEAEVARACRSVAAYQSQPRHLIPGSDARPDGMVYSAEISKGKASTAFDVAVVQPRPGAVGLAAAVTHEKVKRNTYRALEPLGINFEPLVMEQSGGLGPSFRSFVRKISSQIQNNGDLAGQTWANSSTVAYFRQRIVVAQQRAMMQNIRLFSLYANTGIRADFGDMARHAHASRHRFQYD